MRPTRIFWLGLAIAVIAVSSSYATIRINGNQLMSASIDYDASSVARTADPSVTGAPRLIMSFGQGVMGRGTMPGAAAKQPDVASGFIYKIGIGLCYDINNVALGTYSGCPIVNTGDVNVDLSITSADIIYLVNYVFKGGSAPQPCPAAGDVNCDGSVTSADIIYLVNYVFKGGSAPCDVCTLVPSAWNCP